MATEVIRGWDVHEKFGEPCAEYRQNDGRVTHEVMLNGGYVEVIDKKLNRGTLIPLAVIDRLRELGKEAPR